jgi:hypothetical protein
MRKFVTTVLVSFSAIALFTGCIGLQIGGGGKKDVQQPTVGQQLTDLKVAKDTGAISEAEFQAQKTKLLGNPK